MAGNSSRPGASVTSRALALLGAFDDDHRSLTLTQLADRADVPVATAHRLLGELVAWGALVRRATGKYEVGRRLWDLGLLAPTETGLREAASPFLHDLYAVTRATVQIAVRDELSALYLDRLRGHASVLVQSTIGSRLPLHATGVGKVLLAHAPTDVQERALSSLSRPTPYTVVQPGTLRRQLARVVRDGYATTHEEMTLGASSLAVPVRRAGEVVAALGVVVPTVKERARLLAALQVAAQGIGRALDRERAADR